MKNWKLGTKITLGITIIVIICMSQLYLIEIGRASCRERV